MPEKTCSWRALCGSWHRPAYVLLFICTLILISIALLLFLHSEKREALSRSLASLKLRHQETVLQVSTWYTGVDRVLQENVFRQREMALRGQDIFDKEYMDNFRELLIQQAASAPAVISLSVLDNEGHWRISSRYRTLPAIPPQPGRPVWRATNATPAGSAFILGVSNSSAIGRPSIVLGRPVRGTHDEILGVMLAFISTDELLQPFKTLVSERGKISLIRDDGTFLFCSSGPSCRDMEWLIPALDSRDPHQLDAFRAADRTGNAWNIAVDSIPGSSVRIVVMEPESVVLQEWQKQAMNFVYVTVLSAAITLILIILLSRQRAKALHERDKAHNVQLALMNSLMHDPVTGLLNRHGFVITATQQENTLDGCTLYAIGIDGVQRISDMLGEHWAESLLRQLAERLKAVAVPGDIQAITTDHILLIISHPTDLLQYNRRLSQISTAPCEIAGHNYIPSFTTGIAPFESGVEIAQWTRNAIAAMRRAGKNGGERTIIFDPKQDIPQADELFLEQELRAAIGTEQLFMVYQPVLDLHRNVIRGFEALMRWNNPGRGFIPPDTFIRIAENAGIMQPVDQMVARTPLMAAALWPEELSVSVNCSALEFLDPYMPERIRNRFSVTGVSPSRCYIEVTETLLLEDNDTVLSVMYELRDMGIKLAMDDFGTGHASLLYLQKYPFDRIKLDRSFIHHLTTSAESAAIVESVILLGKKLGKEIVAEGVETQAQMDLLRAMGCDALQGYFIGRPVPEVDIPALLEADKHKICE